MNNIFSALLFFSLFLSSNIHSQELPSDTTTTITTIVTYEVATTTYPALALDSNKYPHIVVNYKQSSGVNFDLKELYLTETGWQERTLISSFADGNDTPVGFEIDKSSNTHIVYTYPGGEYREPVYYKNPPGSSPYAIEPLTQDQKISDLWYPTNAIDVDTSGHAHVVYRNLYTDTLKHAKHISGTNWSIDVIETTENSIYYASNIEVDKEDRAHVAYFEDPEVGYYRLKYGYNNGSIWKITTVDTLDEEWYTGEGWPYFYLAVDRSSNPAIAYYKINTATGIHIFYAHGPDWTKEQTTLQGIPISLDIDTEGNPHIFYTTIVWEGIRHGWKENGEWHTEVLTEEEIDEASRGIIDNKGNIHISYIDDSGNLKYLFHGIIDFFYVPGLVR